ncbi:MAG: sulfatase-like hydrolase/transferase, partial [Prolixibacteraceae bacterium]|nr:sulfatase-like hydrolase/transferase [Prolixibacteraceae bacterium]
VAGSSVLGSCVNRLNGEKKPNILLIITDQQHIDTISALGCPYIDTPAMDKIAKSGTSFKESYSPNPVCSPARSSIFTGRMPSEAGVYTNGKSIRETIPNMGEWFREKGGYQTIYGGKWHLPGYTVPEIKGFEMLACGWSGPGATLDSSVALACDSWLRNKKNETPFLMVASFIQPHDICEWLRLNETDKGCRFDEIKDKLPPLPDNFNFNFEESEMYKKQRKGREPAKGNWSEEHWRYYRWSYFRNVEMVDAEIDRLLKSLDETGKRDNTIVVFTSDHGEGLGHHQTVRKSMVYDEAAKVPLIFSWPGKFKEGAVNNTDLVSGYDIMPTLCDLTGIPQPDKQVGLSLKPVLEESKILKRDFVAMEANNNNAQMIRTQQFKYAVFDNGDEYFFDMQNDPGETVNLTNDENYSEHLNHHRLLFKNWISGLDVDSRVPAENRWFES